MPRLLHTLCCCVAPANPKDRPYREAQKGAGPKPANLEDGAAAVAANSIITQVTKGDEPTALTVAGGRRIAGAASAAVTESQTSAIGATLVVAATAAGGGSGASLGVTSPPPAVAGQFVPASVADFKEKIRQKESLLSEPHSHDRHKKCLIVDLDETLVHSSFKPVKNADFIIPVEIDNVVHQVYVLKRPYTDEFLERIGTLFECVLFTASLAKYADPVADLLDKRGTFRARLFREACVFFGGNYVKDLDRLGRSVEKVVIIDNSPASYAFHPENAVPVRTWFDDPHDCELLDMLPLLEELAHSPNIYDVLQRISGIPNGSQPYGYCNLMNMIPRQITNNNNNHNDRRDNSNNYKNGRNNDNNNDPVVISTTTTVITSASLPISYGNNNNSLSQNNYRRNNNNNNNRVSEIYDKNNNANNNNLAQSTTTTQPIYSKRTFISTNNNNNESRFRMVDDYTKR